MTASLDLTDENIARVAAHIRFEVDEESRTIEDATRHALDVERLRNPIAFTVKVPAPVQGIAYEAIVTSLAATCVLYSIERSES